MIAILPQAIASLEAATGRKAGPDTLEPMTLRVLDYAKTLTVADLFKADAIFQVARHAVDRFFQNFDAWITPAGVSPAPRIGEFDRSEEHTSELQSLMRNSYAVFC